MVYLDDLFSLSCGSVVVCSVSKLSELVRARVRGDDSDLGWASVGYSVGALEDFLVTA